MTNRKVLHIQVAGEPSAQQLADVTRLFVEATENTDMKALATMANAQVYSFEVPLDDKPSLQVVGAINLATIAKVARDVNCAYANSIGDNTVVPWDAETPANQMTLVTAIQNRLRYGYTAEQQHEAWLNSKAADGWTYGPIKDVETKLHPAFVPYDQLPAEQKIKDHLFAAVVASLAIKLPIPSPILRPTERATKVVTDGIAAVEWVPVPFNLIEVGNICRFAETPDQVFVPISPVYVAYSDSAAFFTADTDFLSAEQQATFFAQITAPEIDPAALAETPVPDLTGNA